MEDARLVHSTLGHQEMQMRMQIDPVAECLNGGDNPGLKLSPCDSREITNKGAESAEAEGAQELPVVLEEDPVAPLLKPLGVARGAGARWCRLRP